MILGFKLLHNGQPTGFINEILTGNKIHTLRADPNNRWRPGNTIQHAVGVRTKDFRQFYSGTCKAVQTVEIKWYNSNYYPDVKVDGRDLKHDEVDKLAKNDGFDSSVAFFDWFNKDFTGKIIHWTDFIY